MIRMIHIHLNKNHHFRGIKAILKKTINQLSLISVWTSPQGPLFYIMCLKSAHCFISALVPLSRPPRSLFCETLRCQIAPWLSRGSFSSQQWQTQTSFLGRVARPPADFSVVSWFEPRGNVCLQGLFSQLQLHAEADDLLRWWGGGGQPAKGFSWSLVFTKDMEIYPKSHENLCGVLRNIQTTIVFDGCWWVQFRYESSCFWTQIFGPTETTTTAAV